MVGRLIAALVLALMATTAAAQVPSTVATVRDSVTGALVPTVGDTANKALRINCVVGCGAVTGNWLTDAQLRAVAVPISAAALPLPAGASTAAAQTDRSQFTKLTDGVDNVNVTGTSLDINCTGGCGGAATFLDNAAFTFGTTSITNVGAVFDDVAPNAVTENSAAAPRISGNRNLYFQLRDGLAGERGASVTAANALKVDGSAVTQPVSGTFFQAVQPVSDNAGSLTVDAPVGTPVFTRLSDGTAALTTTAGRLAVDPSGVTSPVSIAAAVTVAQATAANLKAQVQGEAASATAKAGNPVQVGAVFTTTQPTVTTGQVVEAQATARGGLIVATGIDAFTVTANLAAGVNNIGDVDVLTLPALPTGANVIGALTANQSVNVAQVAGVAANVGVGAAGATGTQRVVTATDSTIGTVTAVTAITNALPTGANVIGALTANQSVNVAQVGGVAPTMGNGISGTGVQRVTLASDSTGQVAVASLPNEGQQTAANSISVAPDTDNDAIAPNGAAPPANLAYVGGLKSGATGGFLGGITVCDSFVNINVVTATTTLLVTGVAARHVRICAVSVFTAGANNIALVSGTGATCGTGTTGMTGGITAATGYNFIANQGISQGTGLGEINRTNATGDSVCIITSGAVQLSGRIAYAIH